ncbi:unnamed protein product, partial [Brachionus calyciflorus]
MTLLSEDNIVCIQETWTETNLKSRDAIRRPKNAKNKQLIHPFALGKIEIEASSSNTTSHKRKIPPCQNIGMNDIETKKQEDDLNLSKNMKETKIPKITRQSKVAKASKSPNSSQNIEYREIPNLQEDNDDLEDKMSNYEYNSLLTGKKYEVEIYGVTQSKVFNDIHNRIKELERCIGIKSPIMIQPIFDENSNEIFLRVIVDNFGDYSNLLRTKWPSNAFNTNKEIGVKAVSPNLSVLITNVDKNFNTTNRKEKFEMESRYGLTKIERVFTSDNMPTNKLRANSNSLLEFKEIIKNGIYLNITFKKHKVVPNIMHGKVCGRYGSLSHREKECRGDILSLKCGDKNHELANCKRSSPRCINCKGEHYCNSEKLIADINEIFKFRTNLTEINTQRKIKNDDCNLESLVQNLIEKKLLLVNERINKIDDRVIDIDEKEMRIDDRTTMNESRLLEQKQKLDKFEDDLKKLKTVAEKIQDLNNNHNSTMTAINKILVVSRCFAAGKNRYLSIRIYINYTNSGGATLWRTVAFAT